MENSLCYRALILGQVTVVDGDTLRLAVNPWPNCIVGEPDPITLRLIGVDTPEKKDSRQHEAAIVVAAAVRFWLGVCPSYFCWVTRKVDDFGRHLGDLENSAQYRLSCYLLENSLAKPYDGKQKRTWTDGELQAIVAWGKNNLPKEQAHA